MHAAALSENGGGDIDHPQLWVYAPNVVPEPASVVLLGVGGLGACALAWRGRMGRKKSTG